MAKIMANCDIFKVLHQVVNNAIVKEDIRVKLLFIASGAKNT